MSSTFFSRLTSDGKAMRKVFLEKEDLADLP